MPGGKGKIKPKDGKQFSSDYQPEKNGRKPGVRAWKDVLADMMPDDGNLQFKDVQEVDESGKPTGNVFKAARVKMATQEMIVMAAIKQALKGNMAAIDKIWDRMDGRPTQTLANDPDNPITANIQWITPSGNE